MCAVDESIENGVGECGVTDDGMPVLKRQLAGDERSAPSISVLENFQQVPPLGVGERGEAEIIEYEELGACEFVEQLGIGTVRTRTSQFAEHARERW